MRARRRAAPQVSKRSIQSVCSFRAWIGRPAQPLVSGRRASDPEMVDLGPVAAGAKAGTALQRSVRSGGTAASTEAMRSAVISRSSAA